MKSQRDKFATTRVSGTLTDDSVTIPVQGVVSVRLWPSGSLKLEDSLGEAFREVGTYTSVYDTVYVGPITALRVTGTGTYEVVGEGGR